MRGNLNALQRIQFMHSFYFPTASFTDMNQAVKLRETRNYSLATKLVRRAIEARENMERSALQNSQRRRTEWENAGLMIALGFV